MKSKIFVLILGYNDLKNIDECLSSLQTQSYKNFEVIFADNNSKDGSYEYVLNNFPKVKSIQFDENTGYAGGNNKLLKMAFKNGADFCLVLNADTKIDKDLLKNLLETYETKSKEFKVGLIQPLVMIYDKPELINTSGNITHYLGFGYCGNYLSNKVPLVDKTIVSVSGSSMFISKEYYSDIGDFDDDFFMYNEDQNLSWRGLMSGYTHFLSTKGKIWHKYSFSKNKNKMYHSEKNRIVMLLENYESNTLLKLIPVLILNELFILFYSLISGWFFLKIKSYFYVLMNIKLILKNRKNIQEKRKINDKEILKNFESKLEFNVLDNIIIRKIINPFYSQYKKIILH